MAMDDTEAALLAAASNISSSETQTWFYTLTSPRGRRLTSIPICIVKK